ncbi:MAG: hypothetical protein K2X09_05685 [Rickettsiales bacterium]|nr:hypothetical protein [Rickettsiales bacterium]
MNIGGDMAAELGGPWYLDWKMWSLLVSIPAFVISLLPYAKKLKRAKLDCDVYQKTYLTHKVGNPNAQLHVMLTNVGGKEIRVKGMALDFKRTGDALFTLNAMNYLHTPSDTNGILMTLFRIKPGDEWSHYVNFYSDTSAQDQRDFRAFRQALAADTLTKREGLPSNAPDVELDVAKVAPALAYFARKFKWFAGEYEVTLRILTTNDLALEKKLRMTLFETDAKELEEVKEKIKFGFDVFKNDAPGVAIDLVERK